jgi:N-acetyl-anhydromuramyl-L-alanine amidase AmpD
MSNYSAAISMINSNSFANRQGYTPKFLVVHGTAGGTSAIAIATYFASTVGSSNPVSSHYVVGTDGTVVLCIPESDGAYANGALTTGHAAFWDAATQNGSIDPNNITISIEFCKPSTNNSDVLTTAQQDAGFRLIADICSRNNIPKRTADANGGITGHFSLDPINRSDCPGPFPWTALWNYLSSSSLSAQEEVEDVPTVLDLTTPGVAQFWAASADGYWRCTATNHNFRVGGDILSFYKRFGNSGLNGLTWLGLPLTDEFVPKTGTSAQFFEHGVVVRDPNRVIDKPVGLPSDQHCFFAHLDYGFGQALVAQPLVTPLNNSIKSLDAQLSAAKAGTTSSDPATIANLQAQIKTLTSKVSTDDAKVQQAIAILQK